MSKPEQVYRHGIYFDVYQRFISLNGFLFIMAETEKSKSSSAEENPTKKKVTGASSQKEGVKAQTETVEEHSHAMSEDTGKKTEDVAKSRKGTKRPWEFWKK